MTITQPPYVLPLGAVDASLAALVGGKAAQLGALMRDGVARVPDGFVVTTAAFRHARDEPAVADVETAVVDALRELGDDTPCAVRSSATAEDLPTASFAGQYDSFLDVMGAAAVLDHVRRCWASLRSDRAATYRERQHVSDDAVEMAVIVQRMVDARASGVMFTADPVTGDRRVCAIEATAGRGDALVAGTVDAHAYRVRDGDPAAAGDELLTGEEILELARLGRRVEARAGCPQDIEWCLAADGWHVVQRRPITTLFPVPDAGDDEPHVYVSVGHQQMMTDPLRPLGLSVFQRTALRPMYDAGGRLFVDVAPQLASPAREAIIHALGTSDPLIGDALRTVVARGDLLPAPPAGAAPPPQRPAEPIAADPAVVAALVADSDASQAQLEHEIAAKAGPELFAFIDDDIRVLQRLLSDPRSMQVITAVVGATLWLDERLEAWLGDRRASDVLTRSLPDNVTSEMGLAVLDLADLVRRHPAVVAHLERADHDNVVDGLDALAGGAEVRTALDTYLDRYGMRCAGEIDLTRPRWQEQPSTLVPLILSHVRTFEPGAARRRFERGRQQAEAYAQDVLARLRALPDGEAKAAETQRMIDRVRTFGGYREYPKYVMVRRYDTYRRALLGEADRLVRAGVLREREDCWFLTLDELAEVSRTRTVDASLIARRKHEHRAHHAVAPPRVMTSHGEAIAGVYRRDGVPDGALVGLAVSRGVVEGRARVVRDLADADVAPGDILVTAHTDPSWSPLFLTVAGLVTEVGGLMTHGAVIAREYGLPAVVGVQDATRRIADGQRIRLHGTDGHVELLT